jgi:hypothetical protein
MKVNVNYYKAHEAIEKLEMGKNLRPEERDVILQILQAAQGDIIPTKEELDRQKNNVQYLNATNPANEKRWKGLMKEITAFENKYC